MEALVAIVASVWIRNAIPNPDRTLKAVLGIRDILARIRFPCVGDPDPDPRHWFSQIR